MEALVTVIQTLGFPIAVCLAAFWYINKKDEQHAREMESVTQAINNNTIALRELLTKLGG